MKYMLQIYGNVTREQVAAMTEEQQKQLYADWGAVSQTPGVTPAPFDTQLGRSAVLADPAGAVFSISQVSARAG